MWVCTISSTYNTGSGTEQEGHIDYVMATWNGRQISAGHDGVIVHIDPDRDNKSNTRLMSHVSSVLLVLQGKTRLLLSVCLCWWSTVMSLRESK